MAALHLVAVAVTFGGLFLAIFSTVCGVSFVVLAFREGGAGTGTLALLCVPYAAYWAAARSSHRRRWVLLGGWMVGLLLSGGMGVASGVVRQMAGPLRALPSPSAVAPPPTGPGPQYAPPAGSPA